MRIVIYSHTSTYYGAPKAILEVAKKMAQEHEVHFFVPDKGLFTETLVKEGFNFSILPMPNWLYKPRESGYSRFNFLKHLIKLRFNFVKAYFKGINLHINLLTELQPDLVIVNTGASPIGLMAAHKLKLPVILWLREIIDNKSGVYVPVLSTRRNVRRIFSYAKSIVVPSEYALRYYQNEFKLKNIRVIPDSIDLNKISVNRTQFLNKPFKIGLVGSISERKGQLNFVRFIEKHSYPVPIKIFGSGANSIIQELKHYEEKGKCELYGFKENINEIYDRIDVYINLGAEETFGLTTIEAMAAGKLVFGYRSGATVELINHAENGFRFDDYFEIFDTLQKLDSVTLDRITENAVRYAQNYNGSNSYDKLKPTLQNI